MCVSSVEAHQSLLWCRVVPLEFEPAQGTFPYSFLEHVHQALFVNTVTTIKFYDICTRKRSITYRTWHFYSLSLSLYIVIVQAIIHSDQQKWPHRVLIYASTSALYNTTVKMSSSKYAQDGDVILQSTGKRFNAICDLCWCLCLTGLTLCTLYVVYAVFTII